MADVAATLPLWSVTRSSNNPQGSTTVGTGWDDNLREMQGVTRAWLANKGADIASAATTDLGAVEGSCHDITGTVTITSFGTISAGIWKVLKFEGALTLTHNATSLILPGGANITTADGDMLMATSEGSGNWRVNWYTKASAQPNPFVDTNPVVVGSGDATKKLRFEVDGLSSATTRVVTALDEDLTMVGVSNTQTLTGKTLTSPVIDTAVTGTAVATQANQETGTATDLLVTPGRQHFHPSAPKAWGATAAPTTIDASYPSGATMTNPGTGVYTVTHGRTFSSAAYTVDITCRGPTYGLAVITSQTTTTFTVTFYSDFASTAVAISGFHYSCCGDL